MRPSSVSSDDAPAAGACAGAAAGTALTGGTAATGAHARKTGRPHLVVDMDKTEFAEAIRLTVDWLRREEIEVLNVAGPRESTHPGIGASARELVGAVLDRISLSSPS